jgi:hypothetical protein
VAALGNNSLQVIGLKENKRVHSVTGLAEPRRVAYVPSANRVFVANARTVPSELSTRSRGSCSNQFRTGKMRTTSESISRMAISGCCMARVRSANSTQRARRSRRSSWMLIRSPSAWRRMDRGCSSISPNVARIAVVDRRAPSVLTSLQNGRPSLELSHGAGRAKSPAICGHTTTAEAYRIRHLRRQADRKRSRQRRFVMTSSMTSAAGEFRPSAAKAASLFLRRGLETATANLAESRP